MPSARTRSTNDSSAVEIWASATQASAWAVLIFTSSTNRSTTRSGPDLVDLVDLAQHRRRVLDVQAQVETLSQLAVVDPHQHRRQTKINMQPLQSGQGDQGQLDVVVGGELVQVDDVDVGLGELPVATLLRPLTSPDLLDLVATEGERQLVRVLQHVAGERHGQVEVQTQLGPGLGLGVQPLDGVDLLVDLALLGQPVQRLDGPGLDRGEAVQLEGLAQPVEHELLDDPALGGELREARQRSGAAHSISCRYGFAARSRAIVVCGPWPGSTTTESGSGRTFVRRLLSMSAWFPPGKSVLPMEPAKSTSPEKTRESISATAAGEAYGSLEHRRARRVPRGVQGGEPQPGHLDLGTVGQLTHLVGLAEGALAGGQLGHHLPGVLAHRPERVGQQHPVVGVHPAGRVVRAAQRGHGEHVVEVAVGQQHRHGLQAMLHDQLGDAVDGVHPRVDDDALGPGLGGQHITVGLPGTGRKRGDEHGHDTIGQD